MYKCDKLKNLNKIKMLITALKIEKEFSQIVTLRKFKIGYLKINNLRNLSLFRFLTLFNLGAQTEKIICKEIKHEDFLMFEKKCKVEKKNSSISTTLH